MPDIPFLADDVVWVEVPFILWIVTATVVMLIVIARFGWGRAPHVLGRYRLFWGAFLVLALIAAVALHFISGQPIPDYL